MKKITLENIVKCLEQETIEVYLDDEIIQKAYGSVQRMLERS